MQFNHQPIEKLVKSDGSILDVHSIFYTIQGEGPFCGTPAVFLRLAGCNLQCPLCDTEYTQGRKMMSVIEIAAAILKADSRPWKGGHSYDTVERHLVVITGGEPFRQQLAELIEHLLACGYYIQIETNGTLPRPSLPWYETNPVARNGVYIVCSPKAGKVNETIWSNACCVKYVAKAGDIADDGLPIHALDHTVNGVVARPPDWFRKAFPIYLQPVDERNIAMNERNIAAVRESCMKHGYILQLQIHKLIGVE